MNRLAALALLFIATAAEAANFSGAEVFLPVVARTSGSNGTEWRTDVIVANRSDRVATTVTMIYDPVDAGPIQQTLHLDPMATVHLVDFIGVHVDLQSSFGTLMLLSQNSAAPVAAHARVYNVGNDAGEFGQMVQGIPPSALPKEPWLHGLIGFRGFRTNVGIANPNATPAAFSLAWFDKHGEFRGAAGMFEVPPYGLMLFNDIYAKVGVATDEGLTLRIRGNAPIYAYASVIRNDTGDAYTIVGDGAQ